MYVCVCVCVCVCVYIYIYIKDFVSIGIKCVCVYWVTSDSVTLWTVAHQAPLSLEWVTISFSRDVLNPGIEPAAPAASPALAGGFFTTEPPRKPVVTIKGLPQILIISSSGPQKLDQDRLIM